MKTEKYEIDTSPPPNEIVYGPQSGRIVQDFAYTYDSLGNIMNISDQTPDGGVGGTTGLDRVFDYDALYRLLTSSGRENGPIHADPYYDNYRSDSVGSTRAYTQNYSYDEMGNMQEFEHNATGGSFNRMFAYSDISHNNKLESITIGTHLHSFAHDSCGNQNLQDLDRNMAWDYADRMKAFYVWTGGTAEPTKYAQYGYDASGHRVLKVYSSVGVPTDRKHWQGK